MTDKKNNVTQPYEFIELISVGLFLAILIYTLKPLLLFKGTMLTHDHFYWGYPIFQYFTESLINGHFPLWNPFSHGGEPFYPVLLQIRLLDPITLLTIFVLKWVTTDIVLMYNWVHFNQNLVMITGVYVLFRSIASNTFIRISLIPVLLFFSFMFSSFRQPGVVYQFLWVPYIIHFLSKILFNRDYSWHNWIFLGILIGVNWQSYYFCGVWIFLLFFTIGILFFNRDDFKSLMQYRKIFIKFSVAAIVIMVMMLPNLILMLEKEQYVFPARMVAADHKERKPTNGAWRFEGKSLPKLGSILMPYKLIEVSGTFASIWDFIKIIFPEGNSAISGRSNLRIFGSSSEIYFYIGMLPWVIAIIGFICGIHDLKKNWILICLGFGLIILGPYGGLHRVLYYLFPPLWFVRHTHCFVLFYNLAVLYFYVIGFNHLVSTWQDALKHSETDSTPINIKALVKRFQSIEKIRYCTFFILFLGIYIISLYILTHQKNILTNIIFFTLIVVLILFKFFISTIGKNGIVVGIITGHILSIIFFHYEYFLDPSEFIAKTFLLIVIPLCLFLIFKYCRNLQKYKYSGSLVLVFFAASLFADIFYHLHITKNLYQSLSHPEKMFNLKTSVQKPQFIRSRKASPKPYSVNSESMRYISLIHRKPYAFSPVHSAEKQSLDANIKTADSFKVAFLGQRWNSFLLFHNYFSLIHADIPVGAIKEMFAIEKPLFQFKRKGIVVNNKDYTSIFKKLEKKQIVPLLENYVFIFPSGLNTITKNQNQTVFDMSTESFPAVLSQARPNEGDTFSYAIRDYGINNVDMTVTTDCEGVLYWADGFDKRWHVYVEGKQETLYRANVNFKAIVLPKGKSKITFIYKHYRFMTAVMVFWATFFLCVLISIITLVLKRPLSKIDFKMGSEYKCM